MVNPHSYLNMTYWQLIYLLRMVDFPYQSVSLPEGLISSHQVRLPASQLSCCLNLGVWEDSFQTWMKIKTSHQLLPWKPSCSGEDNAASESAESQPNWSADVLRNHLANEFVSAKNSTCRAKCWCFLVLYRIFVVESPLNCVVIVPLIRLHFDIFFDYLGP